MSAPSAPGAFLQLIEYRTDRPHEVERILDRWLDAIGADRTTRWYLTTADRDQPSRYVQIVEFPSHTAAMANSSHPATATFVQQLRAICQGDIVFRNLDVEVARDLTALP
jgi:quinol monooxygenase YgiN